MSGTAGAIPGGAKTASAVPKTILKEGTGAQVEEGMYVKVNCTGTLETGVKFWSTRDPDQDSFEFKAGEKEVIRGWDEAVVTMCVGEVASIVCLPEFAYGNTGFPAWGIPPGATLTFEIEVLSTRAE
mmetsp:Transcript_58174/g.138478  ORF Transcript_58174/g.138478 Transcript_58174/m.138478 type:complete len:127 (-) Transcript_58174:78-458(-)|eukprot:CAMPEP_0180227908 /NCGR_PEP_ID=MMETSP0987-20121128/24444_1 /TAXON_ID=697907 /ORGANISM="non described non described, Strain CCMP2293" /LENGTH=126 /DNA_ID=CAMNT_0022191993 /DNA_START=127 /DNA_END=507 /DNA_ORIENTATION=-